MKLRYTFWKVEFVLMVLAILVMYVGVFISAVYPESPTAEAPERVYLIPQANIRQFLIFVAFWGGVFRGDQI